MFNLPGFNSESEPDKTRSSEKNEMISGLKPSVFSTFQMFFGKADPRLLFLYLAYQPGLTDPVKGKNFFNFYENNAAYDIKTI